MDEKEKRTWTIYCITNSVNGKMYVGQSYKGAERRFNEHIGSAMKGSNDSQFLYRAIRKHGVEAFSVRVLEENVQTQKEADTLEIERIAQLDTCNREKGYNISKGGNSPMAGRNW